MVCQFQLYRIAVLVLWLALNSAILAQGTTQQAKQSIRFVGSVIDADTKNPIAARVYLQDEHGNWLFVRSATEQGTAWPYAEAWVPMPNSVDRHTTVSGHPFMIDLVPGEYQFVIERGKEYLPLKEKLVMPSESHGQDKATNPSIQKSFELKRWSNVAASGWYSGETHVHRRIAELPNVMSAEELNVAFPVTFWTTASDKAPDLEPSGLRSQGPSPFGPRQDHGYDPIWSNSQQVILPRNTEYEIFSIGSRRHTLGAIFVLNHRTPFAQKVPPVGSVVEQARREGALLDLDKHNWPWSLMLVPIAKVDLYELSNNSVWRTNFGFKQPGCDLPPWAEIEQESPGVLTEWGWLQFGFETYYALLNCGFRMSPTAGTASGVHPVPLGFSRVYVHTGAEFNLDRWLEGLRHGRSFVTTGPMLTARVGQELPGKVFQLGREHLGELPWEAEVVSADPISRVEIIVNGKVVYSTTPESIKTEQGAWRWSSSGNLSLANDRNRASSDTKRMDLRSSWVVMRAWSDQPDGRKRFAHTGVWYFDIDQQPVRPPRIQIDYLLQQLDTSLAKQRGVLSAEAIAEFEQAKEIYRRIRATAIE